MMPRDFLADDSSTPQESFKAQPRDFLADSSQEPESKLTSAILAIPRVGEDVIKGGYEAIKKIPGLYQSAKTEIPGALDVIQQHPIHAAGQAVSGLAELGKNVFNAPHDIINYATQRLHLIPQDINQKVQMARMPEDTEQSINNVFGQPKYPGEELIRGVGRNALNLAGGLGAAKTLNPLQLTNKGIAKNVVNELNNQVDKHSSMYNNLWDEAKEKGFNKVPYNINKLIGNYLTIEKYTTPKQHQSLIDFANNPTLQNAQEAQSDLGVIRRAIEEKSKTTPLLGEERKLYDSLYDTEKHIEGNMFKNASGEINQKLADKYQKITKSYRDNVVPYRYNSDIQDYLRKDITAKQLVQRLNQGPFAAKKGGFFTHPQFGIRNALLPLFGGIGTLGGGAYLLNKAIGNEVAEN